MIIFRSILYNLAFYIVTAAFVILGLPFMLGPRKLALDVVYKGQAKSCLWLLKWIAGIDVEVRGRENLPQKGAIVASKHQSTWDTFGMAPLLRDPVMIMKSELMWLPFVGWFAKKFRLIGVKRGRGSEAIRQLVLDARDRIRDEREIFIFPEGNRKAPGNKPEYKRGIMSLYDELDVPCVPIALNSGLYWPRRKFLRYPGTIIVEILPPIAPGLDRDAFMEELIGAIEPATHRLIDEALASPNPPPAPAGLSAKAHIDKPS